MHFKVIFVPAVLSSLVAATHTVTVTTYAPTPTPPPASQCNTDKLLCCNQTQQANSSVIAGLLSVIDIVIGPITALVGVNCSPIDVLGIGSGGACTAQPVCCQNNDFHGLVAIGCTPVAIGL